MRFKSFWVLKSGYLKFMYFMCGFRVGVDFLEKFNVFVNLLLFLWICSVCSLMYKMYKNKINIEMFK